MDKTNILIILIIILFGFQLISINQTLNIRKELQIINKNTTEVEVVKPIELDEDKLWYLVQKWRAENDKMLYIKDEQLCDFARIRLEDIKVRWSHEGFWEINDSLSYDTLGENLAREFNTEKETLSGWLKSSLHKENLTERYTYSCIVCDGKYCVQEFQN